MSTKRPKAFWFRKRSVRWTGGVLVIIIGLGVATPWPAEWLQAPLVTDETPITSDVIIVLGSGVRRGLDPLPTQAKDRLARGAELYQSGLAPDIIVTGGLSTRTGRTEAGIMAPYLEELGVDSKHIFQEAEATDTYENAKFSRELMRNFEWQTALVVTSAYHTKRSCLVFRKLAIQVRCVAAPLDDHDSVYERFTNIRAVVREYGAFVYYFVRGLI